MSAKILDGQALAATVRAEVTEGVKQFRAEHGFAPGLAVVLVGEDPASQVYVRNKAKQTTEVGMISVEHKLPAETSEADVLALVKKLNNDNRVHGILVQLPLPLHIREHAVIQAITPEKDVDGFHVINAGKLATGQPHLVPCTPWGSMKLLALAHPEGLSGKHAVVIGRSNIVGKPMAQLLLQANCTVTIAHSRTQNLSDIVKSADIVVAAIGKPNFVPAAWIKQGATVIDVGINRVMKDDGSAKLYGDVDFAEAEKVAGAITPVPGGVGPMTIACLLENTLAAANAICQVKSSVA